MYAVIVTYYLRCPCGSTKAERTETLPDFISDGLFKWFRLCHPCRMREVNSWFDRLPNQW